MIRPRLCSLFLGYAVLGHVTPVCKPPRHGCVIPRDHRGCSTVNHRLHPPFHHHCRRPNPLTVSPPCHYHYTAPLPDRSQHRPPCSRTSGLLQSSIDTFRYTLQMWITVPTEWMRTFAKTQIGRKIYACVWRPLRLLDRPTTTFPISMVNERSEIVIESSDLSSPRSAPR
jgi:hypothetical protein